MAGALNNDARVKDVDRLVVDNVSKRFGVTQALLDVSVTFKKGEVHALMGENGAGKSTLGKVIAGLHKQDTGTVSVAADDGSGKHLTPGSIDDAFGCGIRIVHQELAQCPNLTVAENLSLHDLPTRGPGLVDRASMRRRATRLLERLEPGIDVDAPLGTLPPGHRQIVQIAASLDEESGGGPSVIVFDEPTSSLSIAEVDRLLEIVRELAHQDGITVIYVSHRMGEIFAACDRVTVLRDGQFVATNVVSEIDEPTLVEQMIGRRLETPGAGEASALRSIADDAQPHNVRKDVLLQAKGISSPGKLDDISLEVHAGEVLGVGGLVGAGRSELLDAIFGLDKSARGEVVVSGGAIPMGKPREMIRAGVGYVPEDRKLQGLFFQLGIDENIVLPFMPRIARMLGLRDGSGERRHVMERVKAFQVKTASLGSLPDELSGGNQQKLLISRWMGEGTRVLLLDEPTRGIDVGTKAEIYKLIRHAANDGAAVLLVSSEMPELLALADRLVVLSDGRLTGELTGDDMTQKNILTLATQESMAPIV